MQAQVVARVASMQPSRRCRNGLLICQPLWSCHQRRRYSKVWQCGLQNQTQYPFSSHLNRQRCSMLCLCGHQAALWISNWGCGGTFSATVCHRLNLLRTVCYLVSLVTRPIDMSAITGRAYDWICQGASWSDFEDLLNLEIWPFSEPVMRYR